MQSADSLDITATIDWFTKNLPSEYLNYPEYYLYSVALETEGLQDIAETRQGFKRALASRKIAEGIVYPEPRRKEFMDFLNSPEAETRIRRARELLVLTLNHQKAGRTIPEAERLAMVELFHREAPLRVAEMDAKYFSSPELIRFDLEAFAKVCGCAAEELTTTNRKLEVICASGEVVQFDTYLYRATIGLMLAKNSKDTKGKSGIVLDELKRKIGLNIPERGKYPLMDKKYFGNTETIRKDLNAYAIVCGCETKKLSTTYSQKIALCTNGEKVSLNAYLSRGAMGLGLAKNQKETIGKKSNALDALKRMLGIEIKKFPMDKKYFDDVNNIRNDFMAFADVCGCEIKELRTRNKFRDKEALCSNGEMVKYNTYLKRAAVGLMLAEDTQAADSKLAITFDTLIRRLGLEVNKIVMDKKYFENLNDIRNDLIAFASVGGFTLNNLSTTCFNNRALCANGEIVRFATYLYRATIGLGLARNSKEARGKLAEILKLLKEKIGIQS